MCGTEAVQPGLREVEQDSEYPRGDFGDDAPSKVKACRYVTGCLTSLGLSVLMSKWG